MFLTDTSEDIDAYFRYIASKKHRCFIEVDTSRLRGRAKIAQHFRQYVRTARVATTGR